MKLTLTLWAFFTPIGNEMKLNSEKNISKYIVRLNTDITTKLSNNLFADLYQDNTEAEDRQAAISNVDVLMDFDHHATENQY